MHSLKVAVLGGSALSPAVRGTGCAAKKACYKGDGEEVAAIGNRDLFNSSADEKIFGEPG